MTSSRVWQKTVKKQTCPLHAFLPWRWCPRESRNVRWLTESLCGRGQPSTHKYLPYNKRLFCLSHYTCLGLFVTVPTTLIQHSTSLFTNETIRAREWEYLARGHTANSAMVKNFGVLTIWSRFCSFQSAPESHEDSERPFGSEGEVQGAAVWSPPLLFLLEKHHFYLSSNCTSPYIFIRRKGSVA